MTATYTITEIMNFLKNCRCIVVLEAIHELLNEEAHLYPFDDAMVASEEFIKVCHNIKMGL